MTTPLRGAQVVLFDTSVIINLEEHGSIEVVQRFLKHVRDGLAVVPEVMRELQRNSRRQFPGLALALNMPGLKNARTCEVPPALASDAARALRMVQEKGDHPDRHAGELATVFAAVGLIRAGQTVRVCMDDVAGLGWAYRYRVPCIRTAEVALELVVHGLDADLGYRIFRATEKGERATRERFDTELRRLRVA